MAKANTSGERDGRIAIWPDGRLIGDFPGLRLRETVALRIDRFTIELRVRSNTWAACARALSAEGYLFSARLNDPHHNQRNVWSGSPPGLGNHAPRISAAFYHRIIAPEGS